MEIWSVAGLAPRASANLAPDFKDDLTPTLIPQLIEATGLPIANLEYRIAPADPYPAPVLDIVAALTLLTSDNLLDVEGHVQRWNRRKIYLVGHSAGAFMALAVVLESPHVSSRLSVPAAVRESIRHIACVDGIYDLPDLLDEYPSYLGAFVAEVFGDDTHVYACVSPANWSLPPSSPTLSFLVLHSREDELLSLRQPRYVVPRIEALLGIETGALAGCENGNIVAVGAHGRCEVDFDSIKGKHEELPHTAFLPLRLARWIASF